jgi:hypothetical protein
MKIPDRTRSYLKIRIFGRNQGATEDQPADIHQYFEDLSRGRNAEFGRKDFFEMAYNNFISAGGQPECY